MPKHCLVVDDSHVIRRIAGHLLRVFDLEASEADSARAALAACGARMPNLILLDWSMPGDEKMSSLDCLQALRRMPEGANPIVLYCTSEHDAEVFDRAIKAGADDVIVKPFDREMLQRKLIANGLL